MPVGAAIKSVFYIILGQVVSWNGDIEHYTELTDP